MSVGLLETARRTGKAAYSVASIHRKVATSLVYGGIAAISYLVAYWLRFEFSIPSGDVRTLMLTLPVLVLVRIGASQAFRLSRGRWRFVSTPDLTRLLTAAIAGSAAFFLLTWGVGLLPRISRAVLLLDLMLYTYFTAGLWIVYRVAVEQMRHALTPPMQQRRRVIVVGAGDAGSMLAREMARFRTGYEPVGFVDDDPAKQNTTVHGLPVFGSTRDLATIANRHDIQEIVISVPSANPAQLRQIVERCEATDLHFKVLPGLSDVLSGNVHLSQLRALRIEDLLGREPITLELPQLFHDLSDQAVLITGAAGSIGSELARQVALHLPRSLVLFDQSETGLFYLERELRDRHPDQLITCVVGDITDAVAVDQVFRSCRPGRVFHAAAYKHVPMMQRNVREAIRNNVFGTLLVARAAGEHGTARFVLVSTDKAVSPTSIMGATKRLAEMLLIELQTRYARTAFAAVRFGNVLGSSGSVIPLFREQIEAGKPLTVTHPDATRYFMTIPEAVQLILQASLLPQVRGQIVMLDMGEPVKIVDLARNLLRISGLPHRNGTTVVFTGLRPGEKLHEELAGPDERTTATPIEKVRVVLPEAGSTTSVLQRLAEWEIAFRDGRDQEVLVTLAATFPGLKSEFKGLQEAAV